MRALNALLQWLRERLRGKVASVGLSPPGQTFMPATVAVKQATEVGADGTQQGGMGLEFEINPKHSIIKKVARLRRRKPQLAGMVAEQLLDNALISAGLLEEGGRDEMVQRVNELMATLLRAKQAGA